MDVILLIDLASEEPEFYTLWLERTQDLIDLIRLKGLAHLYINKNKNLDCDAVINEFDKKKRKIEFAGWAEKQALKIWAKPEFFAQQQGNICAKSEVFEQRHGIIWTK